MQSGLQRGFALGIGGLRRATSHRNLTIQPAYDSSDVINQEERFAS
jgi:hypothetical protein